MLNPAQILKAFVAQRWVLFLWLPVWAIGQQPPCQADAYLVLEGTQPQFSRLVKLYIEDEQLLSEPVGLASPLPRLSALGHSNLDNYLYGLGAFDYHLYRIGYDGLIEDLGIPPGLDTSYTFHSGGIHPDGTRFVLPGRGKVSGYDEEIFSIRLNTPNFITGQTTVISDAPVRIEDLAWDPSFGSLYGFDINNRRLVNLGWPGGLVTGYSNEPQPGIQKLGSLFFDASGELYGYGGNSAVGPENTLFRFDKYTGQVLETLPAPSGYFSDACSCPYRIKLERELSEQQVLPCQEFDITYRWTSSAGAIYSFRTLLDSLPAGFTITEVVHAPSESTVVEGPGGAVLNFVIHALLFDTDSLCIRVSAPEWPGTYNTQAFFGAFPLALGSSIASSDPASSAFGSPNTLRVLREDELFEDAQRVLCPERPLRVEAPAGIAYYWSTGSTEAVVELTEPGLIWLELEGPCGLYRDSVEVISQAVPLALSLGNDRTAILGQQIALPYAHNADSLVAFAWESEPTGLLSCGFCVAPLFGPLIEDSRLMLEITDQDGCTASSSLKVTVVKERQIYAANVFSPNNDGINDVFFLQGHAGTTVQQFLVFDRWGQLVFNGIPGAINDPAIGWDGYIGARLAPMGVYVWQAFLVYPDGVSAWVYGSISLLR